MKMKMRCSAAAAKAAVKKERMKQFAIEAGKLNVGKEEQKVNGEQLADRE